MGFFDNPNCMKIIYDVEQSSTPNRIIHESEESRDRS